MVHTTLTWDVAERNRAIEYMVAQQEATRVQFGCLECYWSADLTDLAIFYEMERWTTEEAFRHHARAGPKYPPEARRLIRRARTFRYTVSEGRKLH